MATAQTAITAQTGPLALFLVVHLQPEAHASAEAQAALRQAAAGFPALLDGVAAGAPGAALVGALAFGPEQWQRLHPAGSPARLRPFATIAGSRLRANATGGDLLLHLHSTRADLNYLVASRFLEPLKPWIAQADETQSFRFLDERDLTGFIDGTENPQEQDDRSEVALIGEEDAAFAGGSYVIAQRYIHSLDAWHRLPQGEQEGIIGRTKPDSVELDDEIRPPTSHVSRVEIERDGEELEILRHSLPYGKASGESGLFFLAYARDLDIFEQMLQRMFGTTDDGLHDRLMEFTEAVTSGYFYAPTREQLQAL